jgi:ornithine carbamoyltransferase
MNLISSNDLSKEQINEIFAIADALKEGSEELSIKEGSVLALLFEKSSTRTRLSFEVAMAQLGGRAVYLDTQTTQLKRGESIADTARMMSSYCDFVAARMYNHSDLIELATSSRIPIINALTDLEHPTQALTDMYTIREHKKNLKNVRIAFVGDIAANTANSLMITATKLGSEVVLVGPKDYLPNPIYFNKAREHGAITATSSIPDGIDGVDVIYTDTFISMGQESQAESRRKLFADYIVDKKMLGYASKDVLVMHCLPAHRGEEIAADVIDGPKSIVWEQAKNKLLIAKAVLLFLSKESD